MQLTPEQYISKLTCFTLAVTDFAPFGRAVQSVHALRCDRIFENGLNSNETPIGEYSTKPMYVSTVDKTKSPKSLGQPKGKHGQSKFKSGKPHTSRYFEGGYFQFRVAIGRNANTVNLNLFGDLSNNLRSGSRDNKITQAVKLSPSEYIVGLDADNALKKEGLESHFGGIPIFTHSKQEMEKYKQVLKDELLNTLNKCK